MNSVLDKTSRITRQLNLCGVYVRSSEIVFMCYAVVVKFQE